EDAQLDEEAEALAGDGEFCAAWSEPMPRFVALPYRAEGGCDGARLPLLFLTAGTIAASLGWLASALGQAWYLILLFPLGIGMVLAVVGVTMVRWTRLRNPTLAGLAGLVAGITAIATMHFCDYHEALRRWRAGSVGVPQRLRDALDADDSFP